MERRYRIPDPAVAHQLIDGEVVIINFITGRYYSVSGSGTVLWEALVAGASPSEAIATLAARYDPAGVDLGATVTEFLGRLEAEGLVAASHGAAGPARHEGARAALSDRTPFAAPVLEVFTDMEDLILLDPVHDVTDAGWPRAGQIGEGS
jgi:hypothetical protein